MLVQIMSFTSVNHTGHFFYFLNVYTYILGVNCPGGGWQCSESTNYIQTECTPQHISTAAPPFPLLQMTLKIFQSCLSSLGQQGL